MGLIIHNILRGRFKLCTKFKKLGCLSLWSSQLGHKNPNFSGEVVGFFCALAGVWKCRVSLSLLSFGGKTWLKLWHVVVGGVTSHKLILWATPNQQHPPVHHEGWMISDLGNSFLLGSSCLANHGGYLSTFFVMTYLLTTHKEVIS